MRQVALEDIATVFACEFTKQCKSFLIPENARFSEYYSKGQTKFSRMSYANKRKLVEKVLGKLILC
jgi:hypothetical protein